MRLRDALTRSACTEAMARQGRRAATHQGWFATICLFARAECHAAQQNPLVRRRKFC